MKLPCLLFLFLSVQSVAEDMVAVRLKKSIQSFTITGKGIVCCSKQITHDGLTSSEFTINYKNIDGVNHWDVFSKDAGIKKKYSAKSLHLTGTQMQFSGIKTPRNIELFAKKQSFDIVAHLGLEEYLQGVLPSEVPALWPMETLKAQAIASRSYTLAMLRQRSKKHFNLESTVSDQVYDLKKVSEFSPRIKKRVYKALDSTKGLVLINKKRDIHKAYYHADCGGQTEEPSHVWDFKATNGTAKDPYCPSQRNSRWQTVFSHKKINKLMTKKFGLNESDVFKNLMVVNKSPSGRVKNVRVQFENNFKIISAQQMREALGFSKMKSTLFNMKNSDGKLTIKGRGHGHGVGLCQWGAKHWAMKGRSYREILNHYYPQAIIKQL